MHPTIPEAGQVARVAPTERIAVVGLGRMGSALADALVEGHDDLIVWNRSKRARAAFANRCEVVASPAEAVASASLVITCVADYEVTGDLLTAPEALEALAGTAVMQLASGTPAQARELAKVITRAGGRYLDGAIATFPAGIGRPSSAIFLAGDRSVFDRHENTVRALAGRSRWVSTDPGAAAVVDQGWLSLYYGAAIGLLQAVAFCEGGGVDPAVFLEAMPSFLVELRNAADEFGRQTPSRHFEGNQASLDVHLAAIEYLCSTASEQGMSAGLPETIRQHVASAIERGHAAHEFASVIDVIRPVEPVSRWACERS